VYVVVLILQVALFLLDFIVVTSLSSVFAAVGNNAMLLLQQFSNIVLTRDL